MNCNAKRHPALKYTIRALQAPHYNLQWTEHFQDAVNSTKLHFIAVQQSAVDHIGSTGDPHKGRGAAAAAGKKEEFICSASLQST